MFPIETQGTEGPWAAAFANAMGGSPDIYSNAQAGDDDWCDHFSPRSNSLLLPLLLSRLRQLYVCQPEKRCSSLL